MISPLSGAHLLRAVSPPGNYRNSQDGDHKQTSLPAGGPLSLLNNLAPVWILSLENHKTVCVCLHLLTCPVCVSELTFCRVSVCLLLLPLLWLSVLFFCSFVFSSSGSSFPLKEASWKVWRTSCSYGKARSVCMCTYRCEFPCYFFPCTDSNPTFIEC